jgi:hypothetical protein
MRLTSADLRQLAVPLAIAAGLLAAGAGLIWGAQQAFVSAQRVAAGAQAERQRNTERLARIAEEEREVKQKIDVYQRLKALNIIGDIEKLRGKN